MSFKSKTQLYCRWCARPIRKATVTVQIVPKLTENMKNTAYSRYVAGDLPKTKQECQIFTNQQIVATSRRKVFDETLGAAKYDHPQIDVGISQFSEWDGESYVDPFFCSGTCAQKLGYAAAGSHHNIASKRWIEKNKETVEPAND
jgi:hypothetical protein